MLKFTTKLDVETARMTPAQLNKIKSALAKYKPVYEEVVELRKELLSHPELSELGNSIPRSSRIRDWGEHLGLTPATLGTTLGSNAISKGDTSGMSKRYADETLSEINKSLANMQKSLKEMKNIKDRAGIISELFKLWQVVYTKYKSTAYYDWHVAAYRLYYKLQGVDVRKEAGITIDDIEKYTKANASAADKKTIEDAKYFAYSNPTMEAELGKMTKAELQTRLKLIKKLFPGGSDSVVKKAVSNIEKVGMDYFNKEKASWA